MKSIFKQIMCICIISLLVCVSFSSAIRVENKIPIRDDQAEDECGCNEISDADIVKLENKLNQLERNSKLLLVFSKNFPIVEKKIKELSYKISDIKQELINGPPNSILCVIFIGLFIGTIIILSFIGRIISLVPFMPDIISEFFSDVLFVILFEELVLLVYYCGIGPYFATLLNLNNLKNKGNHVTF